MSDDLSPVMAHLIRSIAQGALRRVRAGEPIESLTSMWAAANIGGRPATELMLTYWCDAAIDVRGHHSLGEPASPGWPSPCGRYVLTDADRIAPPARWAGRYLTARWIGDTDMTTDLIASAARTQLAANAAALLELAARWITLCQR